jgi:uncharacterized SAM-binding protein YcdF (DUF218 family)
MEAFMKNLRKGASTKTFILSIVLLIALLLTACSAMANTDQAKLVAQFMTAMLNRDIAAAAALFPTGSEAEISPQLEGLINTQFYLFEGYKDIAVTSINVSTEGGQTTATLEGTVAYDGEVKGNFEAEFVKEGDAWKLTNINITVPPEKLPK